MSRPALFTLATLIGYLALIVVIVWGLGAFQSWTDAAYASTKAQSDWQDFRDDVAESVDSGGPVSRSVPKSEEPPALVLLRDYYAECLVISLVLSSALYWTFAFFLRGVLCGPADSEA